MGLKDFSQDCQVAKYMLKGKMASLSAVFPFLLFGHYEVVRVNSQIITHKYVSAPQNLQAVKKGMVFLCFTMYISLESVPTIHKH